MKRRLSHGFTLVELLVVIVILGLLLALLLPSLSAVWGTAHLTKCKTNLNHIWQAQNTRRADLGQFATGQGWVSALLPYLEGDKDTFVCPAGVQVAGSEGPKIPTSSNIYFKNYHRGSTLKYTIDVTPTLTYFEGYPKRWFVAEQYPDGSFKLIYEDWNSWSYDDLVLRIWPPSTGRFKIEVSKRPNTNNWFEFYNGDELLVTVYGNQSGKGPNPTFPCVVLDELAADMLVSDYGMSRGVYETPTTKSPRIDPKLIFILDYPKDVADYSYHTDDWFKYFIEDPEAWDEEYGEAAEEWGYTWRNFQSLRHFGKANVLFCDGRVETVGVDRYGTATPDEVLSGRYLDETNPLWKYPGN